MANVINYGTLKAWLSTTGHRGDLASDLSGFIQDAESMIAENVRAVELVKTAALVEADRVSGPLYNLPSDFLGPRAVTGTKASSAYALKQVSIAELYRYGTSGTAVVFAIYNNQIEFRAAPAVDASFTLIYYARPAAFVQDADTNALISSHPNLYQHAAMHWFHIHTQDIELATAHEASFFAAAESVNALAEEIRGTGSVANQQNYSSQGTM